jgi:hypothetical protein
LPFDDTAEGANSEGITSAGVGDGDTAAIVMSISFVAADLPPQLTSVTNKRADKVARG